MKYKNTGPKLLNHSKLLLGHSKPLNVGQSKYTHHSLVEQTAGNGMEKIIAALNDLCQIPEIQNIRM